MSIEQRRAAAVFGGDYPDPRDEEQRACDRRVTDRQVKGLTYPEAGREYTRMLLDLIRRRRAELAAGGTAATQIGYVPDGRRWLLLAAGELVLRREELEDQRVTEVLRGWGFEERPDLAGGCPELERVVARFVNPDATAEEVLAVRDRLRRSGVRADADHVTPLANVVKADGGAEATTGSRDFGAPTWESHGRVRVAVLDTGIAAEERSDGWLAHDVIERRDDNIDVLDAFPPGGDGYLDFGTGHGTFVTGVVQQVCPEADIRVYSAVDSDGVGTEMQLGCALLRAVRDGAEVVTVSLGSRTLDDAPPVVMEAALELLAEIEVAQQREVLVVAAAGNYGDTRPCWPAAFRRVVAVAGLTADGLPRPDPWSTHGHWVDCSAVGEGVLSTYLEGKESPVFDPDPEAFGRDAWAVWTGTSFAAPQVSGAIARRSSETGVTPREALRSLLAQGTAIPGYGRALAILPGT